MTKSSTAELSDQTRVVVLHGPEAMVKQEHLATLRVALAKTYGELQGETFDGRTAELADVLDELRTFSLMSHYKLVIVDEAEEFAKRYREPLERYAALPVDHATLVLCAGTWRPGNLDKKIKKVGTVIKCETPKPAVLARWLTERAKSHHGRRIDPQAASMLVERLGAAMMRLDTELAKLAVMVEPDEPIHVALIEQLVGKSNDEQAWAVQEMVLSAMVQSSGGARSGQYGGGNSGGNSGGGGEHLIEQMHEMIDLGNQPAILIAYFVSDLFRKLRLAFALREQGVSDMAIGKAMKLWGPRQQLFMNAMRKMSDQDAMRWFERMLTDDSRSKSGFADTVRNLECFVAELVDEVSTA